MPRVEREHMVLGVLGDGRLTIAQMVAEIRKSGLHIYGSNVRTVVKHLFDNHELGRVAEPLGGKRVQYRYARRRALEGPIVDLERAYHGTSADSQG